MQSLAVPSRSVLTLPGSVTPTALLLPEGLTFDEWADVGGQLQAIERSVMWWIGDWVRYGEGRWGEKYAQAIEGTGYSYQAVANAAWVSGKFSSSLRREKLSWSHHKEVAALAPEVASAVLEQAECRGWSVRELRQEVNQLRNTIGALPTQGTCSATTLQALVGRGLKFGTIYADPPWRYGNQATRAATGNHYETLSVDEIAALPVDDLAAEDAHLHLWTTNAFLFDSRAIIEAWGFEYKSCFVWVKPQMGIGNYWRVSHEFLLFAVRGSAPFRDRGLMSWLECERGPHSAKPEAVRGLIERASPPPFLELFGRRISDGWTVWGNEIERALFDQSVPEL